MTETVLGIPSFVRRACFEFRASDFGFGILLSFVIWAFVIPSSFVLRHSSFGDESGSIAGG
jgi:hypothetical protein